MRIAGELTTISGACGVGVLCEFEDLDSPNERGYWYSPPEEFEPFPKVLDGYSYGGAGWFSAGFIDKPVCEETYNLLKTNYKIVFQTPVRVNKNSEHKFIFVLYDRKKGRKSMKAWLKEVEEYNKDYKYPWSKV